MVNEQVPIADSDLVYITKTILCCWCLKSCHITVRQSVGQNSYGYCIQCLVSRRNDFWLDPIKKFLQEHPELALEEL